MVVNSIGYVIIPFWISNWPWITSFDALIGKLNTTNPYHWYLLKFPQNYTVVRLANFLSGLKSKHILKMCLKITQSRIIESIALLRVSKKMKIQVLFHAIYCAVFVICTESILLLHKNNFLHKYFELGNVIFRNNFLPWWFIHLQIIWNCNHTFVSYRAT